MKIDFKRSFNVLASLSKNPLLLVLIGSLVGSYFIPRILAEAANLEAKQAERRKMAEKLLSQEAQVNQEFNELLVTLEIFYKFAPKQSFKVEQKTIREASRKLYLEFNKDVWWQHQTVLESAYVWQLIKEENRQYIQEMLTAYNSHWEPALKSLEYFWKACLSENYRQNDPEVSELAKIARQSFDESRDKRDSVIRSIVGILGTELCGH